MVWQRNGSRFGATFGLHGQAAPAAFGGFTGWILAKQPTFYRMLSGTIRSAKTVDSAAYTLLGISFYGIFLAAGPGHGKAVISLYLAANGPGCAPSWLVAEIG